MMRLQLILAILLTTLGLVPTTLSAGDDLNCLVCHRHRELKIINTDGQERSFYVNPTGFSSSVHADLHCETCHYYIKQTPHQPDNYEKVNCASFCHIKGDTVNPKYSHIADLQNLNKSVHGKTEVYFGCSNCHPIHTTPPAYELDLQTRLQRCYIECHDERELMTLFKVNPDAIATHQQSFHQTMADFKHPDAPHCLNCHGQPIQIDPSIAAINYDKNELYNKENDSGEAQTFFKSSHLIHSQSEKIALTHPDNKKDQGCGSQERCHQKNPGIYPDFLDGAYHSTFAGDYIVELWDSLYLQIILWTSIAMVLFYLLAYIGKVRRRNIVFLIISLTSLTTLYFIPNYLAGFVDKNQEQRNLESFTISETEYVSVCRNCHGKYPHYREDKTRSFMNLHSLRVACETCHVRTLAQVRALKDVTNWLVPSKEDRRIIEQVAKKNLKERPIDYAWYNGSLDIISKPMALNGDNGSKLLPFKKDSKGRMWPLRVDDNTHLLPAEYKVSPIAIECKECHDKKGLLDFKQLGYSNVVTPKYPKGHIANLELPREFEMLQKSEKFLLPSLF